MNNADFEKNVKKLRLDLSKAEETGYLDANFDLKLNELIIYEESLLSALIPIIRARKEGSTTGIVEEYSLRGSYDFSGEPREYLELKDNLFLVLSTNGSLYTMEIFEDNVEIEWKEFSSKVKDIFYMKKIGLKVYLIKTGGEIIFFDIEKIYDIEFKTILNENHIFEFILEIDGKIYFIENKDKGINIFGVNKDEIEFKTRLEMEEVVNIDIMNKNKIITIDINNGVGIYDEEFKLLDYTFVKEEIYTVKILENHYTKLDDIFISTKNGNYIYSFDKRLSKTKEIDIRERVVFVEEQNGTAISISELGNRFVMEENFGEWIVNEELESSENLIFAIGYNKHKYLLIDLYGRILDFNLKRLTNIDDLRNMSLY